MKDDSRDSVRSALGDEGEVRELLEAAGRRSPVPPEDLAAIRSAARAEWRTLVARHGARRPRFLRPAPLALAASLLLVLAGGWWWRTRTPVAAPIASVDLRRGVVRLEGTQPPREEGASEPEAGDRLLAGTTVMTGGAGEPGVLSLRLAGGQSLRLDAGTRVQLISLGKVALEAGVAYVDSAGASGRGPLEIVTPYGSVFEVGTQFEVWVGGGDDGALRVRVREGTVSVVRDGGSHAVARGEELHVDRDGAVRRQALEPHAPAWSWILAAAPAVDIEGMTLGSFLEWACREAGWHLRYEDAALAEAAATIRLHGTIAGLRPDEAVSVVLPGSGLGYRVAEGELLVTASVGGAE